MGFRIISPKRVKKVKTKNGQEVLRRLEEYLESAAVTGEPVEILCGFWEDQQNAITYQELRQAVIDGAISQETLRLWVQDYSILVADRLNNMWMNAVVAGSAGQPILDGFAFEFNAQTQGILGWISERGAEFVTVSTQEQKDAIAALLTKKMRDSHTVDELSRLIRPCIGLTEGDAKAVARFYDSIVSNLKKEHPRMKPESVRRKAMDAAQKYAERKHRQRAMTIAQTESAFAYNRGADEGIRQAQEQGYLGKVKKRWSTSGDDAVCKICASLEGMEIDMDADFDIKGRELFPGQHLLPPAHPRCACAVEYIEISPDSKGGVSGVNDSEENADSNMVKLGEIDAERTDEAIDYYNEAIRNKAIENAVVVDRNGNVFYSEGGASSVQISGIDLRGATITHNHPQSNGTVSFGKDDFYFLQNHPDIRELVAVNQEYTYRVSPISDMKEISYSEYYRKALELVEDASSFTEDLQHIAFEILDREGFVDYVRTKIHK